MAKKTRRKPSKRKSKDKDIGNARIIAAVVILVALALVLIFYNRLFPEEPAVVAIINGYEITEDEFNALYDRVPDIYKMAGMTEEKFLEDTIIPHELVLQKALEEGIIATQQEIDDMVDDVLEMSGATEEEFKEQLKGQNMTYDEFIKMTVEQIMITKILNQTIPLMDIPKEEIATFYEENPELFTIVNDTLVPLEEVEGRIHDHLANLKFIEKLKEDADIDIFLGGVVSTEVNADSPEISGLSFGKTGNPICTENGKPVVILFSTTSCPHCKWIIETFDSVAKEYAEQGKIVAYHWEMDNGDNTLTEEKEKSIPDPHVKIFWENSPQGGVPTFVFGCKYMRIGNAFEAANNLRAEEREFRAIIDLLIEEHLEEQTEQTENVSS
ncbi:SurA N-terminal domain-containing protein [Thermoproteota archaeon]